MRKAPGLWSGTLEFTVAALLWGGTVVPAKWLLDYVAPVTLAAARFCLAALVLLPWALWSHHRVHGFAGMRWGRLVVQGLLGVSLYYLVGYWGLSLTSGSHSSLISAALPLVTAVVSGLMLKEAISTRQWVGGVVAVLGVIAITVSPAGFAESGSVSGDLLVSATTFSWAFYTVLTKRWSEDLPATVMTAWIITFGALFLLPPALLRVQPAEVAVLVTPRGLLSVGYLGIGASALAFVLWNRSLAAVPAAYSSLFLNLLPVVGLLLSVLILDESVAPLAVVGGVVSVVAVFFTAWKSKG